MDTTTAATQANVTAATIRTWCRIGAVGAAKVGGRWVIEATSLARRIALGVRKTAKKVVFSVETMTAIGGNRWTKAGKDRVYLNDWTRYLGLEVHRYNTGNISSAYLDGQQISNSEAGRLLSTVGKVFFDTATGKVHITWDAWGREPRSMDRDDIASAIFGGIRAAIAAL